MNFRALFTPALTAGVVGSLIDSLLGATVQFSGFCSARQKVYLQAFYFVFLFFEN